MQKRNIILISVIAIAAILAACVPTSKNLETAAQQGEIAYKQYKISDYATAKAALQRYTSDLNQQVQADSLQGDTYRTDMMISYVRLAKLEEKNGGTEKERYVTEAVTQCGKLKIKWGNCTIEELRKRVDEMDKQEPK